MGMTMYTVLLFFAQPMVYIPLAVLAALVLCVWLFGRGASGNSSEEYQAVVSSMPTKGLEPTQSKVVRSWKKKFTDVSGLAAACKEDINKDFEQANNVTNAEHSQSLREGIVDTYNAMVDDVLRTFIDEKKSAPKASYPMQNLDTFFNRVMSSFVQKRFPKLTSIDMCSKHVVKASLEFCRVFESLQKKLFSQKTESSLQAFSEMDKIASQALSEARVKRSGLKSTDDGIEDVARKIASKVRDPFYVGIHEWQQGALELKGDEDSVVEKLKDNINLELKAHHIYQKTCTLIPRLRDKKAFEHVSNEAYKECFNCVAKHLEKCQKKLDIVGGCTNVIALNIFHATGTVSKRTLSYTHVTSSLKYGDISSKLDGLNAGLDKMLNASPKTQLGA